MQPLQFGITYQVTLPKSTLTSIKQAYDEKAQDEPMWKLNTSAEDDIFALGNTEQSTMVRLNPETNELLVVTDYESKQHASNIDALKQVFKHLDATPLFEKLLAVFPWENKEDMVSITLSPEEVPVISANKAPAESLETVTVTQKQAVEAEASKTSKTLDQLPSIKEIHRFDQNGLNMIDRAIKQNDDELLALLLSHPEVDPNLVKEGFEYPLEFAASQGNLNATRLLLQHPKTKLGNAYKRAIEFNKTDVAKLLKAYGANPKKLHWRAEQKLAEQFNTALDTRDDLGAIAMINHPQFNPDRLVDKDGRTAFYKACYNGKTDLAARILAQHQPDINTQKHFNKFTPLAVAALNGYAETVTLLLAQPGINPFLTNYEGKSPAQLARGNGYREIAEMIENHIKANY